MGDWYAEREYMRIQADIERNREDIEDYTWINNARRLLKETSRRANRRATEVYLFTREWKGKNAKREGDQYYAGYRDAINWVISEGYRLTDYPNKIGEVDKEQVTA